MKNVRSTRSIPHAEYFPSPAPAIGPARWWAVLRNDYRELRHFWPVVHNMVVQDLRVRYQRSVLGFLWTLVSPIMMMATLTMVFSQVFHRPDWRLYAIYLFAGQVPWSMFAGSLNDAAVSIVAQEGLIRKIYLPKLIFPIARVLINLTTFLLSLVALSALAGVLGAKVSTALVLLPVVIGLLAVFSMGVGLLLAVANTFYRDTAHLIGVVLQAWYFATPILWGQGPDEISPTMAARLWFNPAYPFIRMFQLIICDGRWPGSTYFLASSFIAAASLGIGYVTFKCHEDKLVYRL